MNERKVVIDSFLKTSRPIRTPPFQFHEIVLGLIELLSIVGDGVFSRRIY